jgi:hypothetical protein
VTNAVTTNTGTEDASHMTYTGATSGDYNDAATVSALGTVLFGDTLTDDLSNPLSGKTIRFTLNATETCSASTDGSGNARLGPRDRYADG